jgi:hypothetical protein
MLPVKELRSSPLMSQPWLVCSVVCTHARRGEGSVASHNSMGTIHAQYLIKVVGVHALDDVDLTSVGPVGAHQPERGPRT